MNANWDLAKQLIEAGADVNQWDIFGEAPLFTAIGLRNRDRRRTRVDRSAEQDQRPRRSSTLLLERGANPNMQLFFRPANVRGHDEYARLHAADPRGDQRGSRGRQAAAGARRRRHGLHGGPADADSCGARGPRVGATGARADQASCTKAGTDVNVVALVNHREEIRGGTALHYAVRKRYKEVIKLLASFGIDMNAKDQDGLTALDYTQSRGFMPFMALQTPLYKEEAALLRELGATEADGQKPVWPVLGPPQGIWEDIWPLGESRVHEPVYKHDRLS